MACSHEGRPAQAASNGTPTLTTTQRTSSGSKGVSMSDDLRRVCAIVDTREAPRFDFDSTLLSSTDRSELDQLGKCMTTGPLAGKNVDLVGRTDPRGEAEYNMTLGARRAQAVEHYLAQLGVAANRLPTTSRGALDARGYDEGTWAADRRVDLRLAGR